MSGTAQAIPCDKNKRIRTIDTTKGFIIIAVVLLHFILIVPVEGDDRGGVSSLPLQALYTGLMLFFIYSGYFFRPGRSAVEQIKKRLIVIGIAVACGLIILPILMYIYCAILGMDTVPGDILECYRSLFGNWRLFQPLDPDAYIDFPIIAIHNGYYFLEVMIVAFIMFYPIAERVIDSIYLTLIAIVALITATVVLVQFVAVELPFYAQLSPMVTAFMLFGAILGKYKVIERIEYGEVLSKWNLGLLALSLAVGVVMLVAFPPGVEFDNSVFGDYGGYSAYPYFVICCCFCYLFLSLGIILSKIPVLSNILDVLGKHTLGILCYHIFLLKILIAPSYGLVRGYAFPNFAITEKLVIGIIAIAIMGVFLELVVPRIKRILESKLGTEIRCF